MSGACWEVDARLGPEMWGDFARPICQAMHLSPWHVPLLHCQPLCQGTSNLHSLKGFAKATSTAMQAPCLWIHPANIRIPTQPLCSSGPWTKDLASPSLRFLLESSWEINKTICPAGRGPELEPSWHPCFWRSQDSAVLVPCLSESASSLQVPSLPLTNHWSQTTSAPCFLSFSCSQNMACILQGRENIVSPRFCSLPLLFWGLCAHQTNPSTWVSHTHSSSLYWRSVFSPITPSLFWVSFQRVKSLITPQPKESALWCADKC